MLANVELIPLDRLYIAHSYRLKDEPEPELVESVRAEGIRVPLIVRPTARGYEVVAGRRRFLAARAAGLDSAPAIARAMGDDEAREIEIAENLGRKAFSPPELARAILDRTLARLGEERVRGFLRAEHGGDLLKAAAAIYWRIRNQTEGKAEAP
ncbi:MULTISPECIES: ParB/RepB/Spo0J family partition protein [unclassified Meiothermus]|uniref:ParB/RepB/Spo0J family partition protein n=1 Tax=unclassified Meiothermus TaxID=370471 RepID=UPI000D7BC9E2|nr:MULTISPECIES: ParB/RepB/Spo0J family partition protein [unclassified Meiothermus]PZA06498.1 hypothetical protein DNA98_13000 [Meiothermus sp. Pnk-1]RYM36235.1 ParB/RepB/Spo0J family partition protein [Meiothermus sp. PNK-Is4]